MRRITTHAAPNIRSSAEEDDLAGVWSRELDAALFSARRHKASRSLFANGHHTTSQDRQLRVSIRPPYQHRNGHMPGAEVTARREGPVSVYLDGLSASLEIQMATDSGISAMHGG